MKKSKKKKTTAVIHAKHFGNMAESIRCDTVGIAYQMSLILCLCTEVNVTQSFSGSLHWTSTD